MTKKLLLLLTIMSRTTSLIFRAQTTTADKPCAGSSIFSRNHNVWFLIFRTVQNPYIQITLKKYTTFATKRAQVSFSLKYFRAEHIAILTKKVHCPLK